ncbi:hypothetical protein VNO77_07133 [Canavalia gladiata]|uniref:Uncharacterized protein n=1 Tax=Canavalia gladiata TaxID=3824 RepID=A0AAN9QW02_CANGL
MEKRSDICRAERLAQLGKAMQRIERGPQTPPPKIQRVDNHLRQNPDFAKYFLPRLLSIGPIHHGKENLKLGEQYKLIWTAMHLKENKQDPDDLCLRIEEIIEEVKGLYTEDAIRDYNDNTLVWMLFVDGCSVLQIMEKFDSLHPEELWIKPDQQEHVIRDLHLLENQIPYKILQILSKDEATLVSSMLNLEFGGLVKNDMFHEVVPQFSGCESWAKIFERLSLEDPQGKPKPNHLLDFLRLMFLKIDHGILQNRRMQETQIQINDDPKHNKEVPHLLWPTYKNIRELKAAGIRVERKETLCLSYVSFVSKWFSGVLKLPGFYVDESSPYVYLNMIAYEKCPDFHNNFEICSYLSFLDTLIDDANDVKELRLAGVIQNLLGSDEELAKLLNGVGTELASKGSYLLSTSKMTHSKKYTQVKYQIEKHCRNKWKTWMAQAYNTYFSNPWSICAFLAALLALVLTIIQTWMAIHPNN